MYTRPWIFVFLIVSNDKCIVTVGIEQLSLLFQSKIMRVLKNIALARALLSLSLVYILTVYIRRFNVLFNTIAQHTEICAMDFSILHFLKGNNESHIERRYLHHLSHQQFKHDKSEYSTCIYIQSFFIHHSRSFLPLMYSVFSLRPTHDSYAVFTLFWCGFKSGSRSYIAMSSG